MTPRSPHPGGPAGGGPGASLGSSYSMGVGRDSYFDSPSSIRSPPTGPASLRAPPGGPNQNRKLGPSPGPSTPQGGRGRGEVSPSSTGGPPTGPRGYGPGRSGGPGGPGAERSASIGGNGPGGPNGPYTPRQGRGNGAWGISGGPGRRMSSAGPSPNPGGPAGRGDGGGGIPIGPRAGPGMSIGSANTGLGGPNSRSRGGSPSGQRPFNPPTGPASLQQGSQQQQMQASGMNGDRGNYHRDRDRPGRGSLVMSSSTQSVAQQAMANMPAIIPGGKLDPLLHHGILPEMLPHYQRLREEEERLRVELDVKQGRLRKQLRSWDKMEREARAFKLKSDLSEKSLKTISGEDVGGSAF
ncbi:hypothetical protein SEUCBS139899_005978 [Sporothrix eucalyptigena]